GIAVGGEITENSTIKFSANRTAKERRDAVVSIINANIGESSMMARCTGKTVLQNIEPEDMRSITIDTSKATGIPVAGTDWKSMNTRNS
ncbi:MAG: hypothetical protein CFH06_01071, partial [Alphaproteobacteria bacterium MarineAlpha3_Bin5]